MAIFSSKRHRITLPKLSMQIPCFLFSVVFFIEGIPSLPFLFSFSMNQKRREEKEEENVLGHYIPRSTSIIISSNKSCFNMVHARQGKMWEKSVKNDEVNFYSAIDCWPLGDGSNWIRSEEKRMNNVLVRLIQNLFETNWSCYVIERRYWSKIIMLCYRFNGHITFNKLMFSMQWFEARLSTKIICERIPRSWG